PRHLELGDHALLGAEQRGFTSRVPAVGDHARGVHRHTGGRLRSVELRLRRGEQPGTAPGAKEAPVTERVILGVEDLCVDYATSASIAKAVDRVSFELSNGEFLAVVGESGCGKST